MPHACAIYCRISKEDRDEGRRGLGLKRQEQDCRKLAADKGWPIPDRAVFIDDDVSAYTPGRRPEYARLLDAIKAGDVDAVVVYDLDRLHRHPLELEQFFVICDAAGLSELASVAGAYDLATNDGRLMARMLGAVAKKASDDAARRIRRKHQEIAEAGRPAGGGTRPFGYERDQVTIVDHEAEQIRDAVHRLLAGESMGSLCTEWNTAGKLTSTGRPWRVSTLRNMLLGYRLAGLREHKGAITEAVWPAIVDRPTWERLRAMLTDPSRAAVRSSRASLLNGLARCARCGTKLNVAPVLGRSTYRCSKSPGRPGCGGTAIVADPFEALVVEAVLQRLDTPALAAAARDRGAEDDQTAAVAEADDVEARLQELATMFADGEIGRSEWLTARKGLEGRLEAARRRVARIHHGTALEGLDGPGQLREAWPRLVHDRRRAVLAAVIDRIDVGPARRGLNRFDGDRLDVIWRA